MEQNSENGRHRKRNIISAISIISLLVIIAFWKSCGDVQNKPEAGLEPPPEDLLRVLLELRDELEAPGINVADAAKNLGDRNNAYAFVRDQICYISYRGPWAGADGTLRVRTGNCTDKALLLARLLEAQGESVRFARAPYPKDAKPYYSDISSDSFPAIERLRNLVTKILEKEGSSIQEPDGLSDKEVALRIEKLINETDESFRVLTELFDKGRAHGRLSGKSYYKWLRSPAAPEDFWVWVQVEDKESKEWKDLDPVFPDRARPEKIETLTEIPVSTVQINLESVDQQGENTLVAQWTGPASKLIGQGATLMFLPVCGSRDELIELKDPGKAPLWNALLQVGPDTDRKGAFTPDGLAMSIRNNRLTAGRGTLIDFNLPHEERFAAVPINTLAAEKPDASPFPRVSLDISVETVGMPRWHPLHFEITSEAGKGKRMPVRIDSAYAAPRPVVIVCDESGSMYGRMSWAKKAMTTLVEQLHAKQPVGFMSFHGSQMIHRETKPLNEGKDELLKSINGISDGGGTYIPEAIIKSLEQSNGPAYIVFLTDGQDDRRAKSAREYEEKALEAEAKLRKSPHTFIPFGIGEADDEQMSRFAKAAGTTYRRINRFEDIPTIYEAIGKELAGRVGISFLDNEPAPDKEREQRTVEMRVEGYDKPVLITYHVDPVSKASTNPPNAPCTHLRLSVRTTETYREKPRSAQRIIQTFGQGFDPWQLVACHNIVFTMSRYPTRVLVAREVDELIDLFHLDNARRTGSAPPYFSCKRGMKLESGILANHILDMLALVSKDKISTAHIGPQVLLMSSKAIKRAEGLARLRSIDLLSNCYGPKDDTTRKLRAWWGLATGAVEGDAISAPSVNSILLSNKDNLKAAFRETDLPPLSIHADSIIRQAVIDEGTLIYDDKMKAAWLIPYAGELLPISLIGGSSKGCSVEDTAETFKDIRSVLNAIGAVSSGVAIASGGAMHPGTALSGICALWDEDMRILCYASVMLGLIADGMDDPNFNLAAAREKAAKLAEIPGGTDKYWQRAAGKAAGWYLGRKANRAVAGAVGGIVGTRGAVDSAVRGVVGGGVAYHNPIPGWSAGLPAAVRKITSRP